MTSASLQPLTDKETQNRHHASHSELFLLCQCRDDPDSFGGEKQEERRNGSVMFEGGDLPSQLNCSWDHQCCVRNSENQKKDFTCCYSAMKCIPRGTFYGSEVALSGDSSVIFHLSIDWGSDHVPIRPLSTYLRIYLDKYVTYFICDVVYNIYLSIWIIYMNKLIQITLLYIFIRAQYVGCHYLVLLHNVVCHVIV